MIKVKEVHSEIYRHIYSKLFNQHITQDDVSRYYLNDLLKGFEYSLNSTFQNSFFFVMYKSDLPIGCIALITDSRLDENTAFFGFFECVNNPEYFNLLWHSIIAKAKELDIKKLNGPINGSIWHPYRVIKKNYGENWFPSEPITKDYYFTLLDSMLPSKEVGYLSACRIKYNIIKKLTMKSYISAIEDGYTIEKITEFNQELIMALFRLSSQIFSKSWCYIPLTLEEFVSLYNMEKVEKFIGSVYLAKKNNEVLGFCMNIETPDMLIMKTIGVLPEYQKQGLANALVHKVHFDAGEKEIKTIIYALVNKENNIQHFPKDEVIPLREYSAFEFKI